MGLLKWIFENFIKNTLQTIEFNHRVRKRRKLERYYDFMLKLNTKGHHPLRKKIIEKYKHINIIDKDVINQLRDLAIYFEDKDIYKALSLMTLAYELRPNGQIIKRKYKKYIELTNM